MKNPKSYIALLGDIKKIFDSMKVSFWLDSGTLLGAIRNGKFISWDNDVDLSTYYNEIQTIIANENQFKKHNLTISLRRKFGTMFIHRRGKGVSLTLYRITNNVAYMIYPLIETRLQRTLTKILAVLIKEDYGIRRETFKRKCVNYMPFTLKIIVANTVWFLMHKRGYLALWRIPNRFFSELSNMMFYGVECRIPKNAKEYLKFRYGETWQEPKKNWVWYKDDNARMHAWGRKKE